MSFPKFLLIVACLGWAGFMSAISFMESWVKFRARGLTLALGLEVGRLVFRALNRMEWVFMAAVVVGLVLVRSWLLPLPLVAALLAVLCIQSFWLLPALERRAQAVISGVRPAASGHHRYYAGLELLKLGLVIVAAGRLCFPAA